MNAVLPIDEDAVDVEYIKQRMRNNEPPSDVQEYLWRVRLEAENVPDVVVSDIDPRKFDKRQTQNMPNLIPIHPCDTLYAHDRAWVDRILADFSDLRQLICRWQDIYSHELSNEKEIKHEMPFLGQINVPKQSDECGWIRFFFGKNAHFLEDNEEQAVESNESLVKVDEDGFPPHLRLILQFDQILTRKLLMYQITWLQTEKLSKAHATWIYALLARLEKPLHADTEALIRQLTRRCCELHSEARGDTDSQICLEVLMSISSEYFQH